MPTSPLRAAIVGTGPSGFYAAEALLKALPDCRIDLIDRLPTPYGLVRGGVAPDHQKIKSVTRVFDRIAGHDSVRFIGHVEVGRDITAAELNHHYDAVLYAVGASSSRELGIPGENLPGSHAATELVGWYNGQPDHRCAKFDFACSAAAVIGLGNVAVDVTRILSRRPEELNQTDIARHAVVELEDSQVRTVHVLGRRGPVQAAFTTPELRELGELPDVEIVVDPADLVLDSASARSLDLLDDRTTRKNLEVLRGWSERRPTGAPRKIHFHFCVSPVEIFGETRVEGIRMVRNRLERDGSGRVRAVATDLELELEVGLIFRSVGYRGTEIPGLPFDKSHGVIPNAGGRVVEHEGSHTAIPGVYACGWIKRGPSGVIGTNKTDASETVDNLLADWVAGRLSHDQESTADLTEVLRDRNVRFTTWDDWQILDRLETERGASNGRPREKFTTLDEMLSALDD